VARLEAPAKLNYLPHYIGLTILEFSLPSFVLNPEIAIDEAVAALEANELRWLCVHYDFDQYYLAEPARISLLVVIELSSLGLRRIMVGEYSDASGVVCDCVQSSEGMLEASAQLGWALIDCRAPIELKPIAIAKPWGQEIWYTGIEARGQSLVTSGGADVLLPWFLSVAPRRLVSEQHRHLNLLKILDPLSEPVFGDLYFELHEKKQEVYVVTHVDQNAWPEALGKIKIGFNQHYRAQFPSDAEFVAAFGLAVKQYEMVRREIDSQLDERRLAAGIELAEPVPASQTKQWLTAIGTDLLGREQALREKMDAFKGDVNLAVGDVLQVPCFTPHSLMHGVRTIEFQTPVYERQILSFAQKVLTQDTWDTDVALQTMSLDDHQLEPLALIARQQGGAVERVVDFSDFSVQRITLTGGASTSIEVLDGYALLIGVKGVLDAQGLIITAEQAALISPQVGACKLRNTGTEDAIVLVSFPK